MANPSLQIGNDKWAIKEDSLLGYTELGNNIAPVEIDMTRASAGTRVNPQGLVETVELLGSEEVTNGDFATDTDWTKEASWSIANGKASYNGVSNGHRIYQNIPLTIGKTYTATLDILDSSGNFRISVDGGTAAYTNYTSGDGTYTFEFTSTAVEFSIRASMGYGSDTISVDNISVKESTKNNLARVNYTGSTSSLLAEPQRTNTVVYSSDFSQYSYGGTAPTLTTGQLAPDGTYNATKISGVIGSTSLYTNAESSTTASRSIYARTVSGTGTARLTSYNGNTNNLFTLTEEWQRFELTGSNSDGGTNFYAADFRGSQTLSEFIIWGCQSEEATYPTSIIPTSGSTVTRNQDQYSKTGISDKINSAEGVLFLEMAALSNDGTNRYISINNGGALDYLFFRYRSDNQFQIRYRSNNVDSVNQTFSLSNNLDFNKIALSYKLNEFKIFINGLQVGSTITSGNIFNAAVDSLDLEKFNGGDIFFGKIKQLQVYKTANIDLAALTL